MDDSLKNDTSSIGYGFYTKLTLTRPQLKSAVPLTTEPKSVNGMPNVKWFLKNIYIEETGKCSLFINIETDAEIEYTFYRHLCSQKNTAQITNGCLEGQNEIQLVDMEYNFIPEETFKNNEVAIVIRGFFSYTNKLKPNIEINNVAEWGLRLKENFVEDFDIVVDGQTIKIHKAFVAAESSVFAKMFESNFKEATEKKVTITDSKHKIVQAAINYCYGQNIDNLLTDEDDEIKLLYFCDKYDFKTLKPKLEQHLIQKLTPQNLTFYVLLSDQTNALQLRQACIDFVILNKGNIDMKTLDKAFMANVLQQLLNRNIIS